MSILLISKYSRARKSKTAFPCSNHQQQAFKPTTVITILASPSRQTGLMGSALWASSSAPGMWYMRQKAQAAEDFLRPRVNALLGGGQDGEAGQLSEFCLGRYSALLYHCV